MLSLATSPRALTPTPSSNFGLLDDDDVDQAADESDSRRDDVDTWQPDGELHRQVPGIERQANAEDTGEQFESAEKTLRELLIESNRIKEMVSEAEMRARSWLQTKTTPLADDSQQSLDGTEDASEDSGGQTEAEIVTRDESERRLEVKDTSESNEQREDNETQPKDEIRFRQRPAGLTMAPSSESASNHNTLKVKASCGSPLRTVPSYKDLYNEELIETNRRCYMQ